MKTNEETLVCGVCGSTKVSEQKCQKYFPVPYGQPAGITERVISCLECGSEIDVTSENELESAVDSARKDSVKSILDFLLNSGYSFAQMERALELPQRTLSRWKSSNELSSVGIALLRILRTYPWIIDVAENRFDFSYANLSLIQNAFNSFSGLMQNAANLSFISGGYISLNSSISTVPSEMSFFLTYGKPSALTDGINLNASEHSTLFEKVTK